MVSPDYHKRPDLTGWQRELLDAYYMVAKGRQSGFDANPLPFIDLVAMALLNEAVRFYEPLDLVEIWRELDDAMLAYWRDKRAQKERRDADRAKKAGNN